jgi:GT2 family glycosyltransferase
MSKLRPTVLTLLTCYNRRETTLACLRALEAAARDVAHLQVVLVDAGSTDGTGDAIRREFPDVRVVTTTSDVYWTSGMRMAWAHGRDIPHSHVLWLNDDLCVAPGALAALLDEHAEHSRTHDRVIVVGRVADPASNRTVYGGFRRRTKLSCMSWITPQAGGEQCDTFTGNCVLLPKKAFEEIGNLSPAYRHSLGDMDYGLRATRANYSVYQTKGVVGLQNENPQVYSAGSLPLTARNLRHVLNSPKGLPPNEILHFCRTHGSLLWPVDFLIRYLRAFNLIPSPFPAHDRSAR